MSMPSSVEVVTTNEERLERIDTLLCLLFEGLVAHPLATTMIPPEQLEQLRRVLPG